MADVSNFTLFDQTLQVKDRVAREQISKNNIFSNVIFIGDSFTLGVGATDRESDNYPQKFSEIVSMGRWKRFNGSGFANTGSGLQRYDQVLNNEVWNYAKDFANDVSLVVVEGGWNDTYFGGIDYTSIQPYVTSFFMELKRKFPNAKIVYFFNPVSTFEGFNTPVYYGIVEAVAKQGVIFSSCSWGWIFTRTEYVTGDNLHPNSAGYKAIAIKLYNMLFGSDSTASATGGFWGEQNIGLYWEFSNGMFHLWAEKTGMSGNNILTADNCPIFMKPYKEKTNSFAIGLISGYDVKPGYLAQAADGALNLNGDGDGSSMYVSITYSPLQTLGKRY